MFLDPISFLLAQQRYLDHLRLDRDLGKPFKAKPAITAKLDLRVNLLDNEHALDPYTPVALLVVPWSIGQHVARLKRDSSIAERLRAFVHIEEGANAMSCVVEIVEAIFPQSFACEDIEPGASRPSREDGGLDCNL